MNNKKKHIVKFWNKTFTVAQEFIKLTKLNKLQKKSKDISKVMNSVLASTFDDLKVTILVKNKTMEDMLNIVPREHCIKMFLFISRCYYDLKSKSLNKINVLLRCKNTSTFHYVAYINYIISIIKHLEIDSTDLYINRIYNNLDFAKQLLEYFIKKLSQSLYMSCGINDEYTFVVKNQLRISMISNQFFKAKRDEFERLKNKLKLKMIYNLKDYDNLSSFCSSNCNPHSGHFTQLRFI